MAAVRKKSAKTQDQSAVGESKQKPSAEAPALDCQESPGGDVPRSELVRQIRKQFGVTQAEMAAAMGISVKAIQSYEQGWRRVPSRSLVQLLVLLAIHRRRQVDMAPCWEITNCPPEDRQACPSYMIGDGQFCWFVSAGGQACRRHRVTGDDEDQLMPCMDCEVIRRLLREMPAQPVAVEAIDPADEEGEPS